MGDELENVLALDTRWAEGVIPIAGPEAYDWEEYERLERIYYTQKVANDERARALANRIAAVYRGEDPGPPPPPVAVPETYTTDPESSWWDVDPGEWMGGVPWW